MPEIDNDGQNSYKTFDEYFQKSSLLYKLRNNFAYHLPNPKVVEKAFNSIPETEDWEWYLSSHCTNSFYFSCELIMGYGILNLAKDKTSPDVALGEVIKEVRNVANAMPYFLMPFIRAILFRHFGESILDTLPGVTISDAPSLFEFWIPFFAECQSRPLKTTSLIFPTEGSFLRQSLDGAAIQSDQKDGMTKRNIRRKVPHYEPDPSATTSTRRSAAGRSDASPLSGARLRPQL